MDFDIDISTCVRRCQGGDRAAFRRLFDHYQPRLTYYVRRLDGDGQHEDILQDVWATVFEKIGQLKEPAAFSAWIYRIARNAVLGTYRQKEPLEALAEDDCCVPDTTEAVFAAEEAEQMHAALERIKPQHREVLTLSFIECLPYQAIADVVGCSVGTVRSRIFYAKQSLREEMERHYGA